MSAPSKSDPGQHRVHPAFTPASNVNLTVGVLLAEVVVLREEALRGVIVGVQHDGTEVQIMRARKFRQRGQLGLGSLRRSSHKRAHKTTTRVRRILAPVRSSYTAAIHPH
jgi:hypothetical protein